MNYLEALSVFNEELPNDFTPSQEILHQLNRYDPPVGIAQAGGRYFGFIMEVLFPQVMHLD